LPIARYAHFAFRLARYATGECLFILGNLLPGRIGTGLWRAALFCNQQHYAAALNRASALADDTGHHTGRGWEEFLFAVQCVRNTGNVSASDLYTTWTPGLVVRRFLARLIQGPGGRVEFQKAWDNGLISRSIDLARVHLRAALTARDFGRAEIALDIWRSLGSGSPGHDSPQMKWAELELRWLSGPAESARPLAWELINAGSFVSPMQPTEWAERFIESSEIELAEACLNWARKWIPEEPDVWRLLAQASFAQGAAAYTERDAAQKDDAQKYAERALSLNPQDIKSFLLLRAIDGQAAAVAQKHPTATLRVTVPAELALGTSCQAKCSINSAQGDWTLFVLPPAGWGIMPERRRASFDGTGHATVTLNANRPDRIRNAPWPVMFVAYRGDRYLLAQCDIRVPDRAPGKFLVTITEDHEIHEERGSMSVSMLRRLLVDKSRFASAQGMPWTHMVEAGSSLSLLEWAAATGDESWAELYESAKAHLAEEVAAGNDIQVHLHAFNDPAYSHFPYTVEGCDLRPSLKFLLTSPEARGDWALACSPPKPAFSGSARILRASPTPTDPGSARTLRASPPRLDRLQSVARAVSQVESVGRLGDPDYRAVLWRSGLLEFGDSDDDRAWSSVALRRAGLLAASDMGKPGSPLSSNVAPAFPASWAKPFDASSDGQLLQLPIASNLEGDYLMGSALLKRRARKIGQRLRDRDGSVKPGVHLFTLLTHDKFINARLGADEFRLDPEYRDWLIIRRHMEAWSGAGASFVTAREGVRAVINDTTWRLAPWLDQETFILRDSGPRNEVRYRLSTLGDGIVASESFPQQVLTPIPASLRDLVTSIRVVQGGLELEIDIESGAGAFWIKLTGRQGPVYCTFELREAIGPRLDTIRQGSEGVCTVSLSAPARFLRGRVLLPWTDLLVGANAAHNGWLAWDDQGQELDCLFDHEGLIVSPVRLRPVANGSAPAVEITLHAVVAQSSTPGDVSNETVLEDMPAEVAAGVRVL
jgi:tetratricopeptide (TPR) repeat protein